jgi:hypothetical protein
MNENESLGNYNCKGCNFNCSYKSDWDRHLETSKHKKTNNVNNTNELTENKCSICSKKYSSRSGLWKHSKTCKPKEPEDKDVIIKQSQLDLFVREALEMKNFLSTQIENLSVILREKQLIVNSE